MAKDPAVLFYTSDFIAGTLTMTDEQRGKYIILLCLQHQKSRLSEKDMLNICKSYDEDIFSKFAQDENGLYFNLRMDEEISKRKNYSESRRKNRMSKKDMSNTSKTYDKHMEDENENINRIKDRELIFKKEVQKFNSPNEKEFIDYWTEPNKSGTKMRFELEKTWDLKRRINRWDSRNKDFKKPVVKKKSSNFDRIQDENYDDPKFNRTGKTESLSTLIKNNSK